MIFSEPFRNRKGSHRRLIFIVNSQLIFSCYDIHSLNPLTPRDCRTLGLDRKTHSLLYAIRTPEIGVVQWRTLTKWFFFSDASFFGLQMLHTSRPGFDPSNESVWVPKKLRLSIGCSGGATQEGSHLARRCWGGRRVFMVRGRCVGRRKAEQGPSCQCWGDP